MRLDLAVSGMTGPGTVSVAIKANAAQNSRGFGNEASTGSSTALYHSPVTFTTTTLPNWTVHFAGYNQGISAAGGTGPYNFGVTSGTLPPSVALSTSGVLTGTPTSTGTYTFTVTAIDNGQAPSYTTLDDPSATNGTYAEGISGSNIVGYYVDSMGYHSFLYKNSMYFALNDPSALPGTTRAMGISGNNIVGYYQDATGNHGFLYNGSTYTTLNDPSATAGTVALGISGSNIVGFYRDAKGYHGFLMRVFSGFPRLAQKCPIPSREFPTIFLVE